MGSMNCKDLSVGQTCEAVERVSESSQVFFDKVMQFRYAVDEPS